MCYNNTYKEIIMATLKTNKDIIKQYLDAIGGTRSNISANNTYNANIYNIERKVNSVINALSGSQDGAHENGASHSSDQSTPTPDGANMPIEDFEEPEYRNTADHPYITDLGEHSAYVGENILLEQMSFRKFKNAIHIARIAENADKHEVAFWKDYGMGLDQLSVFELAILRGVKFDYQAIANEFNDYVEKKSSDFAVNFYSLSRICELKIIESKLLGLFDTEIQQQKANGEVTLLQNIITATEYMYSLFAVGLAEYTDLMESLDSEAFFKQTTKKGLLRKTITADYPKEVLLEDYLEMPKNLTNECLAVASKMELTDEELKTVSEMLDMLVSAYDNVNKESIQELRATLAYANNESMPYKKDAPTDHDRDLMFN